MFNSHKHTESVKFNKLRVSDYTNLVPYNSQEVKDHENRLSSKHNISSKLS